MARIEVEQLLDAPPAVVWEDIRDIASHVEWMADAESITFTSGHHEGVGVEFDCATRVGPFRLTDRMETTEWVEAEVMGVRHTGMVTGEGRFTLRPVGADRTRFTWAERLHFPWWMGGPLGAIVGSRVLRLVWRRNLGRLAERFEN